MPKSNLYNGMPVHFSEWVTSNANRIEKIAAVSDQLAELLEDNVELEKAARYWKQLANTRVSEYQILQLNIQQEIMSLVEKDYDDV